MNRGSWRSHVLHVAAALYTTTVIAQSIQRPEYKLGDTWTYRTTTGSAFGKPGSTSYGIEKRTIVKMFPDYFELAWERTSSHGEKAVGTMLSSMDFNDYADPAADPPRQEIKAWIWPVVIGSSWKYEIPGTNGATVYEAHAVDWEEIEVPAGKFRALKVERTRVSTPGSNAYRRVTVWFSPEAKVNVRVHTYVVSGTLVSANDTRDLVSYEVH